MKRKLKTRTGIPAQDRVRHIVADKNGNREARRAWKQLHPKEKTS